MSNKFDEFEQLSFDDFDSFKYESPEESIISRVKDLSNKYDISFIEALEVVKYLESNMYYLEEIKSALYEIDKTIMSLDSSVCKELNNIKYSLE